MAAWANTALVGRLPELELLEEQLRQAVAGQGGTVLVAGDAGIGKTRLVTELGARARAAGAQRWWGDASTWSAPRSHTCRSPRQSAR